MMDKQKAISLLRRIQDPEPYEPQITEDAYYALEMGINALEERRTGKWTIEDVHSATYKYCCSECKAHHRARYDFCPTCGAKMEVEE